MPRELVRYQESRSLHFITFSCYQRTQLLATARARDLFERELERVRRWYGFYIGGYVVMPEHVHLLLSEPERAKLSTAIRMLKQLVSRKLRPPGLRCFWQVRYYDLPVWSERKRVEKLGYIHRNPVERGLVARPEDWRWSSFRQWATGCDGTVEVECQWTALKRELLGIFSTAEYSHTSPKTGERVGQPRGDLSKKGWASPGTVTYDADGNLTSDTIHSYAWNPFSRPTAIDSVTLTYDALGRVAETASGTTYTQNLFGLDGQKLGQMRGQTIRKMYVPMIGGTVAIYGSSGLLYYRHADWLGSTRLASTPAQTVSYGGRAHAVAGPYSGSSADCCGSGHWRRLLYSFCCRFCSAEFCMVCTLA